jgi:hypothetical protein
LGGTSPDGSTNLVVTLERLEIAPVIEAIDAGARIVLARTGNFVAHGVNLLRAHVRASGKPVTVAVGLAALPTPGSEVTVTPEGSVIGTFGEVSRAAARRLRAVVKFDDAIGLAMARCYWPNRVYDVFTASLMLPGLCTDASDLAGAGVEGWRADSGHLWFESSSPTQAALFERALDHTQSRDRLQSQATLYQDIHDLIGRLRLTKVDPSIRIRLLADAIRRYFSRFLVFHNDYDEVIRVLVGLDSIANGSADALLRCRLSSWMLDARPALRLDKSLWEDGSALPIPPFSIFHDVSQSTRSAEGNARLAIEILVVKEWKFYTNKLLFREFGFALGSVLGPDPLPRLAKTVYDERLFS